MARDILMQHRHRHTILLKSALEEVQATKTLETSKPFKIVLMWTMDHPSFDSALVICTYFSCLPYLTVQIHSMWISTSCHNPFATSLVIHALYF